MAAKKTPAGFDNAVAKLAQDQGLSRDHAKAVVAAAIFAAALKKKQGK